MSLSLDAANQSLQVILGFVNKPPAQAAAFVQGVHKLAGWMRHDRFQRVCDEVAKDLPSNGHLPNYKKFLVVYRELESTLNWKIVDDSEKTVCHTCSGSSWVYVTLYNPKDGITDKFAKPCPSCNSRHPSATLPLIKGWVESENSVASPLAPTRATVKFMTETWDLPFDDTAKPEFALSEFSRIKLEGKLKIRPGKKNPFADSLVGVTVALPETGELPPF